MSDFTLDNDSPNPHKPGSVQAALASRDCPSEAITITKVGDKKFECVIDLDKCLYCGQCVDSCNKDALEMTKNYELAALTRSSLKVLINIDGPQSPDPAVPPTGSKLAPTSTEDKGKA